MAENLATPIEAPGSAHRPVVASLSILIAIAIALTWIISLAGVWRGASPAGAAMAILATIPLGAFGAGIAIFALVFRGEDKQIIQYGLWFNGLMGFFAFPLMMSVLLGL